MTLRVIELFCPIISLALNAFVQVISFKYFKGFGLLKSILLGFVSGLAGFLVMSGADITGLCIYILLGYCYFHFINMGQTARRIRILTELYNTPDGLSTEELLGRYDSAEVVRKRLDRLTGNGQLTLNCGRYYAKSSSMMFITKGLLLAKAVIMGNANK